MKEFFIDTIIGIPFHLFGILHIVLVLGVIIGWFIMERKKDFLIKIPVKTKRIISLILITIMFLNMTIYYSSLIYYGAYDWRVHLPLHFCFISGYLFMIAVLFNKITIYKKIYFFAFMGPIPAILFPDIKSSFDAFIFYQQVLSHHFFLLSSLFIFYAYNINITRKDLAKSFEYALAIFGGMFIFNSIFHTNYIMQNKLPDHILKLFPALARVDQPIILLIITGSIMMGIAYLPIYLKQSKKQEICLQSNESLL